MITSDMTRERKTRRISVSISTTKGKKERMALAATEKAKVWTSVRIKYFKVERTRPGGRRGEVRWDVALGAAGVGVGGFGTAMAPWYQRYVAGQCGAETMQT